MSDQRQPPIPMTPIQSAITSTLTAYREACLILNVAERVVLRDVLAAHLAKDYLAYLEARGYRVIANAGNYQQEGGT